MWCEYGNACSSSSSSWMMSNWESWTCEIAVAADSFISARNLANQSCSAKRNEKQINPLLREVPLVSRWLLEVADCGCGRSTKRWNSVSNQSCFASEYKKMYKLMGSFSLAVPPAPLCHGGQLGIEIAVAADSFISAHNLANQSYFVLLELKKNSVLSRLQFARFLFCHAAQLGDCGCVRFSYSIPSLGSQSEVDHLPLKTNKLVISLPVRRASLCH